MNVMHAFWMEYVFEWQFLSECRMKNWMKICVYKSVNTCKLKFTSFGIRNHRQPITFRWTKLHTPKSKQKTKTNEISAMESQCGQGFY